MLLSCTQLGFLVAFSFFFHHFLSFCLFAKRFVSYAPKPFFVGYVLFGLSFTIFFWCFTIFFYVFFWRFLLSSDLSFIDSGNSPFPSQDTCLVAGQSSKVSSIYLWYNYITMYNLRLRNPSIEHSLRWMQKPVSSSI